MINKSYAQYHKFRTTPIQAQHIKYTNHNNKMLKSPTHHKIKSAELTYSDSKQRSNKQTSSTATST